MSLSFLGAPLLSVLIIGGSDLGPNSAYVSSGPARDGFMVWQRDLQSREVKSDAALFGRASEAFKKKDFKLVLQLLENADASAREDVEILNLQGAALTELQRYEEARVVFARVIEKQPNHFWARFNLAEVDFMAGQYAAARKGFQAMKSDKPLENELLDLKTVLAWLKEGKRDEAQKVLEGMPGESRSAAGYAAKAALAFHAGDKVKARELLAESQRLFPGQLDGFLDVTLADFGMTKEALSGK